jgi:DNA-binding beta-propeller fold protein YncE
VANGGSATVTRILKSDSTTTTIAVGSQPYGVAVDETYCWVANSVSNTVTRILKSDLSTTNIAVGTGPVSLGDMTGYAYDNYSQGP